MSADANAQRGPDPRSRRVLWERACFAFVLLVWLECLLATQVFIAWGASRTPVADDIALFYVKGHGFPFWQYLWALHNEHRLPLPKLVQYLLYDWTGDIRSGMFLQAHIYAATALACILAARRLRGGSRLWDAFFPLVWLQLGNSENLLMGFQLGIAIPGACVVTLLLCGALSPQRLWPSRALASGFALLALPLCGGGGLLQAPALAAYAAWLGFGNRHQPEARERCGARIYMGFALATAVLVGLYLVGFEQPPESHYTPRENPPWKLALANLCAPFGPDYSSWRPLLMPAIALGATFLALFFLLRVLRRRDPRALGALAVLAGGALLVAGIAFGRPINGRILVADRYIPLPAPFFVALALGGLALVKPPRREIALGTACALMLAALPNSTSYGIGEGRLRRRYERELEQLVESRADWDKLQAHYSQHFVLGMSETADWLLRYYAQHGLPPFGRSAHYDTQPKPYPAFDSAPTGVRYLEPPVQRILDGELVCCIAPPTTFDFAVEPTDQRFACLVGVPQLLLRGGLHPGVHGRVVLCGAGQEPRVLGEIQLDPQNVEQERGLQSFEFHWPAGTKGVLQLVFESPAREDGLHGPERVALRKARID
jgi:hypothetical protein